MKRCTSVAAMLTMLLAHAGPAEASMRDFMEWLHEFSGPGPFVGLGVEYRFMCYGRVLHADVATGLISKADTSASQPQIEAGSECNYLDKNQHQTYWGLSTGFLSKSASPYEPEPDKEALSAEVRAIPLMLSIDTNAVFKNADPALAQLFDVGVSAGVVFFSGQRFDTFTVWRATPRVTLKLGGVASRDGSSYSAWDALYLQFGVQIIESVRSEQFGALPGARSGTHYQPYLTAGVDVDRFFISLRRQ